MISTPVRELERRGQRILRACRPPTNADGLAGGDLSMVETQAAVGGGSTPGETLASRAIAVRLSGTPPQETAHRLREHSAPIIPRVGDDVTLLDLRTIAPDEDQTVVAALRALLG
jgi:L-seryl-tRNA(Ser) seleniumtransferase